MNANQNIAGREVVLCEPSFLTDKNLTISLFFFANVTTFCLKVYCNLDNINKVIRIYLVN